MARLFFFLCAAICFFLLAIASVDAQAMAASLCSDSGLCAGLALSPPFWPSPDCAASQSFALNCSSHAYWNAFEEEAVSDSSDGELGPPQLLGIRNVSYSTFINLTWAGDGAAEDPCADPHSREEVSSLLPDAINLTNLADRGFNFSKWSYFLLFGCDQSSEIAIAETPVCSIYKRNCKKTDLPCLQLTPSQELELAQTLDELSCSSFAFLAAGGDMSEPPAQWRSKTIQLVYVDPKCQSCMDDDGQCEEAGTCQKGKKCETLTCNKPAVIGIAVSAALAVILACVLMSLWVNHRRRAYSAKSISALTSNRLFTQRAYDLSKKFGSIDAKEFSFKSLSDATKSFSDEYIIGDGGFGAVYLGILKDGRRVAIKRLYHDNFKRMEHFYNEIQILSNLHHPNLVKLYGFCCQDSSDLLLVFEYAANGTVFDQIHDTQKPAMPWKTRLRILQETAEALSYLHNFAKQPIYHRDVKTTNILLDENLHAKLADFGLSRLVPLEATHVSTAPQGTPGYLDPDYHQCYQVTDKSDVYSFGVVLVELVSAKLAVDMSRDRREINLSNMALMKIGCGMWQDLVDPRLEIAKNPDVETMVKRVLELSFMCLHAEKDSRPSMESVAASLSKLCDEFGCTDEHMNEDAFRIYVSPTSSLDEMKHLMRDHLATKTRHAATSTTTSSDSSRSYKSSSSGH